MQRDPDNALLYEAERLLDGSNVHEGRALIFRYMAECWLRKRPGEIAALHKQLLDWVKKQRREKGRTNAA